MYDKIVFINLRMFKENGTYVCELPLYELFIAKALEARGLAKKIEIYTVYTHEDYATYVSQWRDADVIICWETYTRSQFYVEDYFGLADYLKKNTAAVVAFGGAWPSSYGSAYPEFKVFDAVIKGFSIDGVADVLAKGFSDKFEYSAIGPSNFEKYELDTSYIVTDPQKYVIMGNLLGYLSTFGCPGNCTFCVNQMHRELQAPFSARPLDLVKKDIETLAAFAEFDDLNFRDDNFFADLDRANEIIRHVIATGKHIDCNLTVRVTDATNSFFDFAEDWSLQKNLYFGLESMFPEEREAVGKPFSDETLWAFFENAERREFMFSGNIIFGLPFHTQESILAQCDKAMAAMHEFDGLLINSNSYIPKSGTAIQKKNFSSLHSRFSFSEMTKMYQARTDAFQSKLYGDRFDGISLEGLSKSFLSLITIKRLRQHFPNFAQWTLDAGVKVLEGNIRKGAKDTAVSKMLDYKRITKTRRVLTRACIQYHKMAGYVPFGRKSPVRAG